MKREIPADFRAAYDGASATFRSSLEWAVDFVRLRLSQLAAKTGTRATISSWRVKRCGGAWRKAQRMALPPPEALFKVEDLLGIRIVCHNLSDVPPVQAALRTQFSSGQSRVKDMITRPTTAGYRAIHLLSRLPSHYTGLAADVPIEIQIRTLAQDAWAQISRADLYKRHPPQLIEGLAVVLAEHLAAIDRTAQLVRDELNKPAQTASALADTDSVSPQGLALIFKETYGEEIYEYTLIDWRYALEEAEVETMGEVLALLRDSKLGARLDRIAEQIRGSILEPGEWAVFAALVAAEGSREAGVRAVRKRIQRQWDEITTQARQQVLPGSIEEFAEALKDGDLSLRDSLAVLDCFDKCVRCGNEVFLGAEAAVEAVLRYYGKRKDQWDLQRHLADLEFEEGDTGLCSYCSNTLHKD